MGWKEKRFWGYIYFVFLFRFLFIIRELFKGRIFNRFDFLFFYFEKEESNIFFIGLLK